MKNTGQGGGAGPQKIVRLAPTQNRSPSHVVITGGAGFLGSNIADALAARGEDVLVFDSLARPRVEENLAWLRERHPQPTAACNSAPNGRGRPWH